MAGYATRIIVTLTKEGSIKVDDDGRGIPVDIHPKTGLSTVETVLTVLNAGGKFDNDAYKISGGLHGVGASVTNALSKWMKVWVNRNGKMYFAEFSNGGKITQHLKEIGAADKDHGTTVEFFPDFTVMEKGDFDHETIAVRLRRMSYLSKGLRMVFIDEIQSTKDE
jgi:DNA gyrase subunit B